MRVLVLAPHPFYQVRGTPMAVKSLIEVLTRHGHAFDVLTFHEGNDPTLPGCRIHRTPRLPGTQGIPPGFSFKKVLCDVALFAACVRLLRRERFDVVHAVEESTFLAAVLGPLFKVPFVYDMDSLMSEQLMDAYAPLRLVRRPMRAIEGWAIRRSTAVLAVCPALADVAREQGPDTLVGCVEDYSLLDKDVPVTERLRDRVGADAAIVLYVGNLEPYQGIDLLLDGFAAAAQRVPAAHLVVIGGAAQHIARYRDRAQELGLADRAHFLGPRPAGMLAAYLQQADVLVSPRVKGRNTPMKVYSYLDSGRAVLATRLPTHTQVLDDEIACLTAPEPTAMGAALAELLAEPERRDALGRAARERVRREYSPHAFERKLVAFYDKVACAVCAVHSEAPP